MQSNLSLAIAGQEDKICSYIRLTLHPNRSILSFMSDKRDFFGTAEAAKRLGIKHNTLTAWLTRNPLYRPETRFNTDDLLWTSEDVQRVKEARKKNARHGRRNETSET